MKLKSKEIYKINKIAKVGENISCPFCGKTFIKKQYSQSFCCSTCKDGYWNRKKDRHRPGYYQEYNEAHPERLERIGIHQDENGKFGHFDSEGNWWTFEQEQSYFDMCENPILGI